MANVVLATGSFVRTEYHYSDTCSSLNDSYSAPELIYRHTCNTVENVADHRPRPAEPLWKNPTAQALQSTHHKFGGLWKRVQHNQWGAWCNATQSYNGFRVVTRELDYFVNPVVSLHTIDLDWQTKMRLDIKDAAVNLGVSLAEYRQTAQMFKKFGIGIHKAWKLFRGRLPTRSKITPCSIAAAELTASYGVEPLVSDLYDSMEVLLSRLDKPIYRRFVSRAYEDRPIEEAGYQGRYHVSHRAIAYVELEPDASDFTLGNPLELAWEVVPFSFVVDWAIPVGDYLSALDALKDVKSVTGTVTKKTRYFHQHVVCPNGLPDFKVEIPCQTTYRSHSRDVLASIPLPRAPTWNPSKSWRAISHGLSLLTALNQRCKP